MSPVSNSRNEHEHSRKKVISLLGPPKPESRLEEDFKIVSTDSNPRGGIKTRRQGLPAALSTLGSTCPGESWSESNALGTHRQLGPAVELLSQHPEALGHEFVVREAVEPRVAAIEQVGRKKLRHV